MEVDDNIIRKIFEDLQELKSMKSDVQELKSDVQELKSDVQELKSDVQELKSDVQELKSMKEGVDYLMERALVKEAVVTIKKKQQEFSFH